MNIVNCQENDIVLVSQYDHYPWRCSVFKKLIREQALESAYRNIANTAKITVGKMKRGEEVVVNVRKADSDIIQSHQPTADQLRRGIQYYLEPEVRSVRFNWSGYEFIGIDLVVYVTYNV